MKITLLSVICLLFVFEIFAQNEISGKWKIGTSKSTVEIIQQKESFKGKIVKVTKDNRKLEVEQLILSNVNYVDGLDFYTCKIKITNGFAANCEFKFLDRTKSELQMTAKFMFFSKTVKFRRLD